MFQHDPLALSRALSELAPAVRSWLRQQRQGVVAAAGPFERHRVVASRATFAQLTELAGEPLHEPLRRWVYRMTELRVDAAALARTRELRYAERVSLDEPLRVQLTRSAILREALGSLPTRQAWLGAFARHAAPLADAERLLWERRADVARRMGLETPDGVELPEAAAEAGAVYDTAEAWLAQSRDAASEAGRESLGAWLEVALGSDARHGWPAHLTPRWLAELFAGTELLRSVEPELGPLPAVVGAASFARALRRFGAAWAEAVVPQDRPYVVAHDPYGLGSLVHGALFAGLLRTPSFARLRLGLSPWLAREQCRQLAAVALLDARAAALRVLARRELLRSPARFPEVFVELVAAHLGLHLSPVLAGALWRLSVDDGQRFVAPLLASLRAAALRDAHDEDWFANPRAIAELRGRAELSPETATTREALSAGAHELLGALAALR